MTAPNEMPPPPGAGPIAAQPAPAQPPAAGGPNIASIIKRMLAHLGVAVVVLGLGVSVTMVMSRSRKPTWTSETVIHYREGIKRELVGAPGEGDVLKALPARLKEILLSRAHLERLVREFNLYPNFVAADGYIGAVDRFRNKITFKPRSTETFLIAFEGSTPEEAQQVTAKLADVLIEDMAERKRAAAKRDTEFLESEKKRADEDLYKCEAELAGFIAKHPEFAAENNSEQAGSGVRTEMMKAVADPELLALTRQQQRLRSAIAKPAGGGPASAGGGAADADPALAALASAKTAADSELAAAQRDLDQKSEKLTDAHPDVRMAKARVAAATAKQREATAALIAATPQPGAAPAPGPKGEDPYAAAPVDEKTKLARELAATQREIENRKKGIKPDAAKAAEGANRIVALETDFRRLYRERDKARQRQTAIDDNLFKADRNANSELGGYNAQVMVLDPAYLPNQAGGMSKLKFILAGIAASIAAGLVAAAAWGMFLDDRLFMAEEVAGFAPVLAAIPKAPPEKRKKRSA